LNVNDEIGKRIRKFRTSKGMTMEELGARLGISAAAISRYELGQRKVSFEMASKIADVLGVSVPDILTAEDLSMTLFSYGPLSMDDAMLKICDAYEQLNSAGKREAAKRITELTRLPEYTENADTEDLPY